MIQKFTVEELIPIPHDCVISKISLEHDHMIFTFENRLFNHESIQKLHPSADSLIMRFHLTHYQGTDDFRLYVRKAGKRHEGYKRLKNDELLRLAITRRSLLHHVALLADGASLCRSYDRRARRPAVDAHIFS